jgi:hypothetical protein
MKKTLLSVALASFLLACGNTECEDAKEKAKGCGGVAAQEADRVSDDDAAECNSRDECRAKCVNGSTCAELNALNEDLVACIAACG